MCIYIPGTPQYIFTNAESNVHLRNMDVVERNSVLTNAIAFSNKLSDGTTQACYFKEGAEPCTDYRAIRVLLREKKHH